MAAAFSTNAEDAFTKSVDVSKRKKLTDTEIESYYEITRCVEFLERNGFCKVALQFPDSLLEDSFKVSKLFEMRVPTAKVYILGDTSYGSCCVDEVAAEHVKADCILHFGRACLSLTRRLPVLYVFGAEDLDVDDCCSKFMEIFPDDSHHVVLFHDVVFQQSIGEIQQALGSKFKNLVTSNLLSDNESVHGDICANCGGRKVKEPLPAPVSQCCGKDRSGKVEQAADDHFCSRLAKLQLTKQCNCNESSEDENQSSNDLVHNKFGRSFVLHENTKLEDYDIFYIGKESLTLKNLMMTYNRNKFYTYDPEQKSARKETLNVNKALMRRYYLIQKAKDAKTVGIVAGTLGVADYMLVLNRLKKLLKQVGKKYYTFMMGKPNVPKMANFMEVDIFVLVACPENSLIDSQEFYRPIITPFEMEVACSRARDWTGEYITDFRELLPGAASHIDIEKVGSNEETDVPDVSLITGNLIQTTYSEEASNNSGSTDIMLKNQQTAVSTFGPHSAAEFLHTRGWQGLERNTGETKVIKAVEGRKGISIGYTHEPVLESKPNAPT